MAGDRQRGVASRSSSTSASARSIPAVTPAEVQILPSRTKIGSGSTSTPGYSVEPRRRRPVRGRAAAVEQARGASRNAPVHTAAVRLAPGAAREIHSSSAPSAAASLEPAPARHDQRVELGRRVAQRWVGA